MEATASRYSMAENYIETWAHFETELYLLISF